MLFRSRKQECGKNRRKKIRFSFLCHLAVRKLCASFFLRRLLFFRKYAYLCPRNGQGNAVRIGDSTRCCESKKPCDNRLLSFSEICATGTRKLLRHFRGLCKSAAGKAPERTSQKTCLAFRGFSLRDHRCGHYCLREHYCLRFFSPLLLS